MINFLIISNISNLFFFFPYYSVVLNPGLTLKSPEELLKITFPRLPPDQLHQNPGVRTQASAFFKALQKIFNVYLELTITVLIVLRVNNKPKLVVGENICASNV